MKHVKTLKAVAGGTAAVAVISAGLMSAAPAFAEDIVLRMAVPDWPPTRIMKDLFDKSYKAKSGNNVTLEPDFIPWPDYYTRLSGSLTSGEKRYSMAVSDSQWLGAFIEGGYYQKLNDAIDADPELQKIMDSLNPALVEAYSTYPHKSKNYYGFPQMPDVLVAYYRTDVFCDAGEAASFKAKYNAALPCTPEEMNNADWDMVQKFGEFFGRKKGENLSGTALDDDFYGIAYQAGKGYDFSTMQIASMIWQHGGDIWDETKAPTGKAEGVVNSPEAVAGFERYLSLLQYMPPVVKTGTMDIFKQDELFREGKVAYMINWIGFAESSIDGKTSKVSDKVDFAMAAGLKKSDGSLDRTYNIGGQPFVLMTWNDDTTNTEALEFVKWWLSPETQVAFAKAGGQSGLKSVYEDASYNSFRPWNHAFGASLNNQKDIWHIPEFFELLVQQQAEFDKAITGQQDAKTSLDAIAKFQEELLQETGHIE